MPYSVQDRVQAYIPTKLEGLKSEGSAINKQLRYNTNVQKCERVWYMLGMRTNLVKLSVKDWKMIGSYCERPHMTSDISQDFF